MVRKRQGITEDDVARWTEQGFGQGSADAYKPWAKVRDVPSKGRSTRIAALRHKRIHHLYSDVETGHLLQVDYSPGISEIREQIALLPREETMEIAKDIGVKHPFYRGTQVPIVMTSDLYVLRARQAGAPFVLCVKPDDAIQPGAKGLKRTLEKLEIEKCYWQRRGVCWRLVTEKHFDLTRVTNLAVLRPTGKVWRSREGLQRAMEIAEIVDSAQWRGQALDRLLDATGWGRQETFEAIGNAIWRRLLQVDLSQALNLRRPLALMGEYSDAA